MNVALNPPTAPPLPASSCGDVVVSGVQDLSAADRARAGLPSENRSAAYIFNSGV
jgi:hypothetical protein